MEQQEVSNFLVLQSTPSQTSEQGKASYTPALSILAEGKKILNVAPETRTMKPATRTRFSHFYYVTLGFVM